MTTKDMSGAEPQDVQVESGLTCGIVMPISPLDGCSAEHWSDVKALIQEAVASIDGYQFKTDLVSEGDDVGVIHRRIVRGVYTSDIVVCDVSGKNPNVMFELGLRLAFDKPTVIIKDDRTDYPFDTGIIEHITYPRDLRYARVVDFKQTLAKKVRATYIASKADPAYSMFLKHFGEFNVAQLQAGEPSENQAVLEALADLRTDIGMLRRQVNGAAPLAAVNLGLGAPTSKTAGLKLGLLDMPVIGQMAGGATPEELNTVLLAESLLRDGPQQRGTIASMERMLKEIAVRSASGDLRERAKKILVGNLFQEQGNASA